MLDLAPSAKPPRVVFVGMRCAFAAPPLAALLRAGFDVRGVVLPRGTASPGEGVDVLVQAAGLPVLAADGPRLTGVTAAVAALRPDVLAVACFPWRLPTALLATAPLGGLNVHPSLLPAGRGPQPVFWTLRRGERRTGVTIHRLDERLDTGPIVAQQEIDVPEGIRAPELELSLADLGGRLLVDAIRALVAGRARFRPQNHALATAAPVPTAADYLVPTNLPARWAFTFVRGVAPLGGPLHLLVLASGDHYPLRDALDYTPVGTQAPPLIWETDGQVARVRFRPGVARLLLAGGPDVDLPVTEL